MQLSITSLTCAVRQLAGSSLIQYNQDVVTLGMHSAVTAADALDCVRNAVAMNLLAAAQAVDLRGSAAQLGAGCRRLHRALRVLSPFLERDRAMEDDINAVSDAIRKGSLEETQGFLPASGTRSMSWI
jgi:phenylalanine ammonia-lyase